MTVKVHKGKHVRSVKSRDYIEFIQKVDVEPTVAGAEAEILCQGCEPNVTEWWAAESYTGQCQ